MIEVDELELARFEVWLYEHDRPSTQGRNMRNEVRGMLHREVARAEDVNEKFPSSKAQRQSSLRNIWNVFEEFRASRAVKTPPGVEA